MKKTITKKTFKISFYEVIDLSISFLSSFKRDKALFIAKSPEFNDPFESNFSDLIKSTRKKVADRELGSDSINAARLSMEKLEECQEFYQEFLGFLRLIYGDKSGTLNYFGSSDYTRNRQNKLKMISLMEIAHSKADEEPYKSELIASGFSQASIDKLLALSNELKTLQNDLENIKRSDQLATQERLESLNLLWSYLKKLSIASRLVFPIITKNSRISDSIRLLRRKRKLMKMRIIDPDFFADPFC